MRQAGMKGFCVIKAVKVLGDLDLTDDRELYTPSQKKMSTGWRKRYAADLK